MATLVNDRIDVRISKEHKELIKYAAEISGFKTVSEFIVTLAKNEANRIIEEESKILKSMNDKVLFVETLLDPPTPNKALEAARKAYNQFSNLSSDDLKGFRKKA
ncbi:type II toxin-antitoxin system TacA family antitoxin [Sphingobacterium paludis]|uniref:Uncharacterized protein (DUF1778 family) n=1 Tax=Sphingobacterium paludis TaxID=1476465 RepID=A0A4R7CZ71_9SPHI|nr:DUF1778 domain-containing protein [Sphingobacterium paludis]TDS13212.1 uncharacterized protein (DUF1778 family) [Sphingobacterium paludis]